jgi:hypothetical protein
MAICTRAVGEYPETEAQFIRDQLEAGRYVCIDHPNMPGGLSYRVTAAKRRGTETRVRAIDGLWTTLVPGASIIRIERA